jgi:hypothetical protein
MLSLEINLIKRKEENIYNYIYTFSIFKKLLFSNKISCPMDDPKFEIESLNLFFDFVSK